MGLERHVKIKFQFEVVLTSFFGGFTQQQKKQKEFCHTYLLDLNDVWFFFDEGAIVESDEEESLPDKDVTNLNLYKV